MLCATLSFVTYALLGHKLDPATIFSSLQFFNIIRAPLLFFPMVASACSDGYVSLGRIGRLLLAEEMEDSYEVAPASASSSSDELADEKKPRPLAVRMHGDFTWERGGGPGSASGGVNLHAKFGYGGPGGGRGGGPRGGRGGGPRGERGGGPGGALSPGHPLRAQALKFENRRRQGEQAYEGRAQGRCGEGEGEDCGTQEEGQGGRGGVQETPRTVAARYPGCRGRLL